MAIPSPEHLAAPYDALIRDGWTRSFAIRSWRDSGREIIVSGSRSPQKLPINWVADID
jgi:hypothetical protein